MQENAAKTTSEWVFVARSVAQFPDSQSQALRSMARAGILAQDVSEWIAIAKAWAQDFDDLEITQQCLAKAEPLAEDSEDWEGIAEVWVEIGYFSRAIEIYREHVGPRPWQYLTELKNIYGERSDGTTVLDWVEPGMTARVSRDLVSEAEEYFSDNQAMAIRVLVEAEIFADCSSDWVRIAKRWREEFQHSEGVERCMQKAEDAVDDVYDWVRIAKTWKDYFQDSDTAFRCLKEAEECGGDVDSWEWIFEIWKEDFQDPDNYLRCVEKCADDLENPWSCIGTAIYDEFAYHQFIREQAAFIDLGTLTESVPARIGVWGSECVSERLPGSYDRYYGFNLPYPADVTILLESDELNSAEPYLYLLGGYSPSGGVLAKDRGSLSLVKCNVPPGLYTIEAATAEKVTELFTLKLLVKT